MNTLINHLCQFLSLPDAAALDTYLSRLVKEDGQASRLALALQTALGESLADQLSPLDLYTLRSALMGLQSTDAVATKSVDIGELSRQVANLVLEREKTRRTLELRQFAIDQHTQVSMSDLEGNIIYANDRFCAMAGYPREALLGKNHRILNSGFHPSAFFDELWQTLVAGQVWQGEICNRKSDNTLFWVDATIVPMLDAENRIESYIAIRTDITDRKRIEEELRFAKESAEASSRAKSDFLANMSHEIRTPMNGVIGMTDLALETALTDEQREYLSIVKSSAESLLTVINDILDFSKIEAGKLQIEEISFDLHRVINDTLKSLALKAFEKHIELVADIQPGLPRHVMGDPGRIRQVLVNLLGNAIKFTEEGEVAVIARLISDEGGRNLVEVAVRDTGIGIPVEKQRLIFDAFAQEDSSTTRRYGGTGLGLSISRHLVELMGGGIRVESIPGQGSTFTFSLALQIDENPPPPLTRPVDLKGRRVLIVDDNRTNRKVLVGMLSSWEMDPVAVNGGEAALALLRQGGGGFDCILLDAHMPVMDGYTLAKEIASVSNSVPPMLMLSSGALRGDAQRCQALGISAYFSKPISAEELLAALCRVFGFVEQQGSVAPPHQIVTRHALRDLQRPLKVLLVEDHPVNQKLAKGLLERWGHTVVLAENGQVACDLTAQQSFDIVLMDMLMPVMGGLEATRLIRAREQAEGLPHLPIVAMTAAAMQSDRDDCEAAGMDDHISKPIRARDLMEKLLLLGAQPRVADTLAPVAFDYAEALGSADQEMVEIIAEVFMSTCMRDIARLRDAAASDDLALFARTAHSLKGTLPTFGALPAERLAADLEQRAMEEPLSDLLPIVDSLEREIGFLIVALRKRFPQLG